jgi:hypothetical protein
LVLVAIVTAVAPTIAALGAWRSAGKANKAVNNRPGEAPTISDDVSSIRTAVASLQDDHGAIRDEVRGTREALRDHLSESERRFAAHVRDGHPRRRGW